MDIAIVSLTSMRQIYLTMPAFSRRQWEIFEMVANGLTSKAIGRELRISPRTVETHLERMRNKLHVKTTPHLVSVVIGSLKS